MPNEQILVVEDDTNLLSGIQDILELEDYTITTAVDGVDALEKLNEFVVPPDLILSDIMMPRMDGIEFLTRVRQQERFIEVPFIYLTAKGEKSDIQRGKRLGVDDYVVKPFNAEELIVAVRSRLDRAEALRQVQQGREQELKNSILTILNHEFRTPLTFVVAYADLLGDVSAPDGVADEHMTGFLGGIKAGADRLRRLVENFILLVELQTDSAATSFAYHRRAITDLPDIIEQAVTNAKAIHTEIPTTYTVTLPDHIPTFYSEPNFLTSALTHLIDNAFKFSKESDTPIEIVVSEEGDELLITVTDFGRGIAEEEHENIWQIFYQIDRQQNEDQGAGSGLTIVEKIAKLHGGSAYLVRSEVGEGSTFALSIPLAQGN